MITNLNSEVIESENVFEVPFFFEPADADIVMSATESLSSGTMALVKLSANASEMLSFSFSEAFKPVRNSLSNCLTVESLF